MPRSRYGQFILYSILLHLLLIGFFSSGLISMDVPPPDVNPETTMTLMEQPPIQQAPKVNRSQNNFIPTVSAQTVAQANPNATLESDHNTKLQSGSPARDPNSNLPDLRGDARASLNYYDVPASTAKQEVAPTNNPQQKPPEKPKQDQAQQQPTPATPPKPTEPTPQQPPAKPEPVIADALPLLPPKPQPPAEQTPPPKPPAEPQTSSRPPPSPAFSLSKSRSDIRGNGIESNMPSPEARETELGRYKSKIYRAIGSRWYLNVDIAKTDLSIGTVRIKFYIQSNGVVSNLEVLDDSGSQILHTISVKAILDSAPFEPFSEAMKQQLGDGYFEEFTFSIY